jgi:hypothetical protein
MKLRILIFILTVIIGFAAYRFFTRSNPVLYRYVDQASVQYSAFIIQNPFREREPERQAGVVLQQLKNRNCQQALSLAGLDSSRVEYLCEREQKYPVKSWGLMDRKGEGQKIQLIYRLYRNNYGENSLAPPAWIDIEKMNSEWRVVGYETYY